MQLGKKIEARAGRIINVLYYTMMLAAFYLFMRYAFWLVFPFLFSFFVAMVLQKPMNYAHKKIRLKKSFSAVALVLLFYLSVVVIIALLGVRLFNGAKAFIDFLMGQADHAPKLIRELQTHISSLVTWLPDSLEERFNTSMGNFVDSLLAGVNAKGETVGMWASLLSRFNFEWLKTPLSGMLITASKIPSVLISAAITVVSSFFMTTAYDSIVGFIKRQLNPEKCEALSASKRILFSSLGKLIRSYAMIIGVTFGELMLGLFLLTLITEFDGKYLLGIAMVTALVDILPVLGTGSILVPWALYHLIMGNIGFGIGLLVLYAVIIVVRQVLEPKLIASNLGLPPIVTLAGMFIGLQLFGFIGLFILPLLLILLKVLNDEGVVRLWKRGEKTVQKQAKAKEAPKP
ncbi:MAG: sporulation integral membrane protein YtvI [Oscillospiraceae bacterium]|jgi:sporulation integral membrane protein YtvI|nr:sporulation integral membrane protein YtvI [Oscillospiraceae bacterium]